MNEQGESAFPNTHWTLIARAKSGDDALARKALNELCGHYQFPLYCFIRRSGLNHQDAEDALQDFFVKVLRLETFAAAEEARGRLRGLLVTSLRRFLVNWQRDRPYRRREVSSETPGSASDTEQRYLREVLIETDTPERVFDRKWGHELLARVLARLRESYASRGRAAVFEALRPALAAGGSLRGLDAPGIAASLGVTESAIRATLARLLAEYREILESEVFQTVASRAEVEEEIAHLLSVFRKD